MELDEFYFIILKAPYDNLTCSTSKLPIISKIKKGRQIMFKLDKRDGEGPFDSLFELKRKSLFLAGITKQKDRQRILKSKNIEEISDFFFTQEGTSIDKNFFDSFTHITIGQISNRKVKGIHFYNPERVRIKELIKIDNNTGIYSAKIESLNKHTNEWIEKDEITTFFPDEWTASKLFLECYIAYKRKHKVSDNVYISYTQSRIKVKFVIDNTGKIFTFFPVMNNE
ncbi:MAG: EndoU domain-containing protein [Bacteroidales bacterium]|nr:EndoU domain-containing protein [Bacteroidales bacterium]